MTHSIATTGQNPQQTRLRLLIGFYGLLSILAVQALGSMELPKPIQIHSSMLDHP